MEKEQNPETKEKINNKSKLDEISENEQKENIEYASIIGIINKNIRECYKCLISIQEEINKRKQL